MLKNGYTFYLFFLSGRVHGLRRRSLEDIRSPSLPLPSSSPSSFDREPNVWSELSVDVFKWFVPHWRQWDWYLKEIDLMKSDVIIRYRFEMNMNDYKGLFLTFSFRSLLLPLYVDFCSLFPLFLLLFWCSIFFIRFLLPSFLVIRILPSPLSWKCSNLYKLIYAPDPNNFPMFY